MKKLPIGLIFVVFMASLFLGVIHTTDDLLSRTQEIIRCQVDLYEKLKENYTLNPFFEIRNNLFDLNDGAYWSGRTVMSIALGVMGLVIGFYGWEHKKSGESLCFRSGWCSRSIAVHARL